MSILDVDTTFFTFLGYPMSYLEFIGTILNLISVYLVTRNNVLTWPIGNIAVVLFGILFYQVQLYSDFVEQIYFLATGFYGWWVWVRLGSNRRTQSRGGITRLTPRGWRVAMAIVAAGTVTLSLLMANIHRLLGSLFPTPAAFPFLDAFTTVMSFTAQILMAHKKLESWYLWIAVDIIGVGLYYARGVRAISLLYAIFLLLAIKGLLNWRRELRSESSSEPATTAQGRRED